MRNGDDHNHRKRTILVISRSSSVRFWKLVRTGLSRLAEALRSTEAFRGSCWKQPGLLSGSRAISATLDRLLNTYERTS